MIHGQRVLAIIPARAGSKRLPGKNIKLFHRKPLVEWSIIAAKGSKYIDDIILSTDIDDLLELAREYVIAFHHRPGYAKLATDDATLEQVSRYAIGEWTDSGLDHPDLIILLQPTSPLRTTSDIDNAIESFFAPLDSLISFVQDGNQLKPNGSIYIKRTNRILQGDKFYQPHHSKIFIMPPERSIDIDTAQDFTRAENAANENPTP